jgi:tetratricopeptide (TPR) repeat protein
VRLKLGDPAGAVEDFVLVWQSDESSIRPSAAFHLALAEQERNRLNEAEKWLREAIRIKSDFAEAHLVLGTVLEREKRFEEAGRAYREVLALQPRSAIATLRFGVSAWRAGFKATAIAHLRRVESLAPGSREAMEAQKYLLILE